MRVHNGFRLTNLSHGKTSMVSQRHLRKKPELGLAVWMRNMHVNARLFARKEEEAKLTVTNNGWCHIGTVTNFRSSRLTNSVYLSRLDVNPGRDIHRDR